MEKKVLNKIYSILYNFLFAIIFITAMSSFMNSQTNYNKFLYIPPKEQPKTFIELLFDINEPFYVKEKNKFRDEQPGDKSVKRTEQDTSKKENRILSLRDAGEKFYLYLELLERDQTIDITVYNMLGKNVQDVYKGSPRPKEVPYEIVIAGSPPLPNGPYLCVVVGRNFRLAQKFLVIRR